MHELAFPLLVGLIVVALAFDFLNGLHDAANSIATVVGTRLISPVAAVAFAAFFNFGAYFLALRWPELHKVADTIGKGIIDKDLVTPAVVFGALVGAMFWNVVTWLKGIPSSSSHALVGGLSAPALPMRVYRGSMDRTQQDSDCDCFVADAWPILTMAIMLATSWLGVRASPRGGTTFRGLHLVSAGAYSLGHGLNDAQKTMGIISVLLYSTGHLTGISRAALGCAQLLCGDRTWHADGGLADHRNDGHAHHQAQSASGLFSASAGGSTCCSPPLSRDSGLDDPHHHRLRHRRGSGPPGLGGALGDCS